MVLEKDGDLLDLSCEKISFALVKEGRDFLGTVQEGRL